MNDDIDLSLDDGGLGSAQNIDDLSLIGNDDETALETPEQLAAREKLANDPGTLKARIAALEAEKITAGKDVEIAKLRGKLEATEEFGKRAPVREAPAAKVYTQAELDKMNEQLVAELSTNPLAALQRVRDLAKADALAEMQAASSPALGTAGAMVIENFLTRMSKSIEPKWYALAEKEFHAETSSLDPAGLLQLPVTDRNVILKRFWDAALGRVTATMLSRKQTAAPRNMGGGSGGGGGANQPGGIKKLAQSLGYTELEAQRYVKASFPNLTPAEGVKAMLDAIAS